MSRETVVMLLKNNKPDHIPWHIVYDAIMEAQLSCEECGVPLISENDLKRLEKGWSPSEGFCYTGIIHHPAYADDKFLCVSCGYRDAWRILRPDLFLTQNASDAKEGRKWHL